MRQWRWIEEPVVRAIHEALLAEHGGALGLRDGAALAAALARPQQLAAAGNPDTEDLAAAYGYAIARQRPFSDGNKRTALVCSELFLLMHGIELQADDAACVSIMLAITAGEIDEADFAALLRATSIAR